MNTFGYDEPTESDRDYEAARIERSLCAWCFGERRQAAPDEETCLLVGYPAAGTVCKPCALADWGDNLLRGTVPLELLEPEDRTLTHRELALSTSAAWGLLGRMPTVAFLPLVDLATVWP